MFKTSWDVYEKLSTGKPLASTNILMSNQVVHHKLMKWVLRPSIFQVSWGSIVMMYVVLMCCVHDMCAFYWVCGSRLHWRLVQNVAPSTPNLKGRLVGKGIVGVNHASKGFTKNSFTWLCGLGKQMVMVTKVYMLNVKLTVEELEWNPNVQTLDEACVSLTTNKTYILHECK